MPLKGKYLKYDKSITLEIFQLIWDKLKSMFPYGEIYDWTKDWSFESFKKHGYISIWGENNYCFGINNNQGGKNQETTVQEILGYDPFVKDNFVLPERWCIKSQSRDQDALINEFARESGGSHWRDEKNYAKSYYLYINYGKYNKGINDIGEDYIEITFDQFKQYVLKQPIKHSNGILDAVEKPSKQPKFKVGDTIKSNPGGWQYTWDGLESESAINCVKSGDNSMTGKCTKVTYSEKHNCYWYKIDDYDNMFTEDCITLAEVKSKDVAPEYVECIEDIYGLEIGKIYRVDNNIIKDGHYNNYSIINNTKIKPSTKEAYELQNKPKQPLKQAVHCKTQEEWNFITEKLNYKWSDNAHWTNYGEDTCINLEKQGFGTSDVAYKGYQILSFQEWCDLNRYKMEKECEVRAGEYFVTLNVKGNSHNCARDNYCFKQRETRKSSWPEIDLKGSTDNGHDIMSFDKKHSLVDWRYATTEEVAEYDRIGKPYDVTALKSKEVKPDKQPLETKEMILDESYIGKLVSLTYSGRFYDEVLVTEENGKGIHLLNNVCTNCDEHSDKSIYKYSLFFEDLSQTNQYCSNIKLLEKANIIEDDLSSLSITELHEKGLVKRFFEEVVKADFNSLPNGSLCSYNNFAGKNCNGLDCDDCYLKDRRRDKLKSLLEIKEQPIVKSNEEFQVGDWVIRTVENYGPHSYGRILQISKINKTDFNPVGFESESHMLKSVRHATPEEINNHLISIGQAGDVIGTGIEPNEDGMFKYTSIGSSFSGKCSSSITRTTEISKPKEEPIKFKYFSED